MRVLHCISSLDPAYGGPVQALKGLTTALSKHGVQQGIFAAVVPTPSDSVGEFGGAAIFEVNAWVARYAWMPVATALAKVPFSSFDLLHIHGLFNGVTFASCEAARALNIPYVLEPFGTLSPYCMKRSSLLKRTALIFGGLSHIQRAAAIRCSSLGEQKRLSQTVSVSHDFVVGHGIDFPSGRVLRGYLRTKLQLSAETIVFLFLGRLHPIKGIDLLIPAFRQWREARNVDACLVIAGFDEGGYERVLRKLAGNPDGAIHFIGAINPTQRFKVISDADAVVLASYHENFGLSAVEGMACGKPVLISENVDIAPSVKEFDLGQVFHLTLGSVVSGLDSIYLRRREWPAMGERGHIWARRHCDWSLVSSLILSKYSEILRSSQ